MSRGHVRKNTWPLLNHTALVVLAIPCLLPLVWMLSTSLKTDAQIFPRGGDQAVQLQFSDLMPHPVKWTNYPEALTFVPFALYLRNTLIICLTSVLGAVLSSAFAAYGFTQFQFRGRGLLFMLLMATMALPGQVTMVPVFLMYRQIGWCDTWLPLIVPSFLGIPFFVFLMATFFRTLPRDLFEAARIDGCGEARIFFQICLPLSVPVMATCALFQFLWQWNDFLGPLLFLNSPEKFTLAYGLQQFLNSYEGQWSYLMAAATVFTAPIILLFFFTQRTFIQGITFSGLKG